MTASGISTSICLRYPWLPPPHTLRPAPNPRILGCRLNRYDIDPNISWRDELLLANGGKALESRLQDDAFFWDAVDRRCVDNVRMLLADAEAEALVSLSGMSEVGYTLFRHVMRHSPRNPWWFGRDRLVVTAESRWTVLLGILLHLSGFGSFQIDELKWAGNQWALTEGSVEDCAEAAGLRAAAVPLAQGLADAVCLAFEEARLAERFNKTDAFVVDHRTYYWAIGGSCTRESIDNDAASFAVHLKLHKLTVIYCDDDHDLSSLFKTLGWNTFTIDSVHEDMTQLKDVILFAQKQSMRPTFVQIKTFSMEIHYEDAIQELRKKLHWEDRERFYIIPTVYREFIHQEELGRCLASEWKSNMRHYQRKYPHDAEQLRFLIDRNKPYSWENPPTML